MIRIELLCMDESSKMENLTENEESIGIEKLNTNEVLKTENIVDSEKSMQIDELLLNESLKTEDLRKRCNRIFYSDFFWSSI